MRKINLKRSFLCLALGLPLPLMAAEDLPKPFTFARYQPMMDRSPFAVATAVAAPVDPFRRLPPHVWVYEELEKLLARRLAEEGRIGLFYDELTRIVKQYLEGRYRVDLLERTTSEVPGALQSAGAPSEAGVLARTLLTSGDHVKFARLSAGPADCREAGGARESIPPRPR